VYYRSSKTTNQWVRWPAVVVHDPHRRTGSGYEATLTLDLSVPTATRVTSRTGAGLESAPTNPVWHAAVVPPHGPGQHWQGWVKPVEEIPHRSRQEVVVTPPLPPPPLPTTP